MYVNKLVKDRGMQPLARLYKYWHGCLIPPLRKLIECYKLKVMVLSFALPVVKACLKNFYDIDPATLDHIVLSAKVRLISVQGWCLQQGGALQRTAQNLIEQWKDGAEAIMAS